MKLHLTFLTVAAAIFTGLAAPSASSTNDFDLLARAGDPPATGGDPFYYTWWTDNQGAPSFKHSDGQYTIQWSGNGEVIGGAGWNPGSKNRTINYSGTYQPNGTSYLSVYGWTRSPLVEYYIVESYGTYNPSSAAQKKGTVYCNGANYDVLSTMRYNQPSIDGTQTFAQFWSVRNPKRDPGGSISGSVDVGCHSNVWSGYGMNLGSQMNYQVLAVEGYFSSGNATIKVAY